MSEDEGLGKNSDDKDLFEVDSDSNDDAKNNNDEIKARLLYSMKKYLANVTTRVNEGGSDIIDRIRIHLSNRIKECVSTNVVDPDNLVDVERRTQKNVWNALQSPPPHAVTDVRNLAPYNTNGIVKVIKPFKEDEDKAATVSYSKI